MAIKKIKCTGCGDEKAHREFFATTSDLFNDIGKIPICKDCIKDRYSKLLSKYNMDMKKSFQRILMTLDVYWDEELLDNCMDKSNSGGKDWFGEYFRLISSNGKYNTKSTLDNIEILEDIHKVNNVNETEQSKNTIPKKLIKKWGKGLELDDYEFLEDKYEEYSKCYKDKTPSQRTLLMQISKCLLRIEKAYIKEEDDAVTKFTNTLSKLMADADIKPSSKTKLEDDEGMFVGKIMQIYERNKPIVDKDKIYDDVDWIYKYFYRFFIKPFAMARGLAHGNYDVDDGDKNIEVDDDLNKVLEESKDGD